MDSAWPKPSRWIEGQDFMQDWQHGLGCGSHNQASNCVWDAAWLSCLFQASTCAPAAVAHISLADSHKLSYFHRTASSDVPFCRCRRQWQALFAKGSRQVDMHALWLLSLCSDDACHLAICCHLTSSSTSFESSGSFTLPAG
jgi:hypothetical protein